MRRVIFIILVFVSTIVFSGCFTFSSSSLQTLETRVQSLENRIYVLEKGDVPAGLSSPATISEAVTLKAKLPVAAEDMTKKQVQEALKNAGYYAGDIDGKFGANTKKAIREFQGDFGLKVDGVAGSKTKEKLLNYL